MAPLSYENLHNYSKNANFDKLTHLKCYGRNISNVQIFKNNPIPNLKVLNLSVKGGSFGMCLFCHLSRDGTLAILVGFLKPQNFVA